MRWLLLGVLVVTLAMAACTKRNPAYCEQPSDCTGGATCDLQTNTCEPPPDGSTPETCTMSSECLEPALAICDDTTNDCRACMDSPECAARDAALPVCSAGVCVVCAVSDDCPDSLPVCDPVAKICEPCDEDLECENRGLSMDVGVCDEGQCPSAGVVIFVDKGADCVGQTPDGSPAKPYCEIQPAIDAIGALSIIKVRAGHYGAIVINGGDVLKLFGAAGAVIDLGLPAVTRVDIEGDGTQATVRGFEVALATTGYGVHCRSGATCRLEQLAIHGNATGLVAQAAPSVTLASSRVFSNDVGGIYTFGTNFVLENNLIYLNGGAAGTTGGVYLGSDHPLGGDRLFRHNTMWQNFGSASVSGALECTETTTASSSIFWENMPDAADDTNCTVRFSIIDEPAFAVMNMNLNMDPLFVLESFVDPDLHIMSGSPCIDNGAPDADAPVRDGFGQERDAMPDIGADELGMP